MKIKFNYSLNLGVQQAAHVVPMANANEYINYVQSTLGLPVSPTGYSTNWYDEVLRNAFYQNHNLSISGGNKEDRYAFSASYQTNQGIIIYNDYAITTASIMNLPTSS